MAESRILIVGGSCDLALSLATLLVAKGERILATWRSEAGRQRIMDSLARWDRPVELCRLDFEDRTSLADLEKALGSGVDGLVDMAHGDLEVLVANADDNAVTAYVTAAVAFRAAVIKRVARCMLRQRKGRMVFVSSTAAGRPNPGQGFYAATKLATEALYRNVGLEMGAKGITTAILRPGYIAGGRGARYLKAHPDAMGRAVPTDQPLTCAAVAETLCFLLSDAAAGINGGVVTMDGELTIGK